MGYGDYREYLSKWVYDWFRSDAFFDSSLSHTFPTSVDAIQNFDQLKRADQEMLRRNIELKNDQLGGGRGSRQGGGVRLTAESGEESACKKRKKETEEEEEEEMGVRVVDLT
jgi:hypothetical protein